MKHRRGEVDTKRFYTEDGALIVRAHHAIMPSYLTQHVVSSKDTEVASRTVQRETDSFLRFAYSPHQSNRDDARDYIGNKPEAYASVYGRKVLAFVTEFLALDDSAPVEITKTHDGICQACAIGQHCFEPQDEEAMPTFVEVAEWLGKVAKQDYIVTEEDSVITSVRTNKATVVEVILNTDNYYEHLIATDPRYEDLR